MVGNEAEHVGDRILVARQCSVPVKDLSYEWERNLNHYGDAKMAVAAWKCGWRHRLQNKHPLAVREKIRTAWRRGFLQKPWNP